MDKKYTGPERRHFPRIKIPLLIFYRLETDKPFALFKAISQNIGGGGLMFETEKFLPIGSKLLFEIYQPSVKYKDLIFLLTCRAKVIWTDRKEGVNAKTGDNKYQIGVEFMKMEKEDKDRIMEYVEKIVEGR